MEKRKNAYLDDEKFFFERCLVFTSFTAASKKVLYARLSVFNCKQNFLSRIICKKHKKLFFSKFPYFFHSTHINS